ncbi:MAG: energy-coupling factor transporter transmembrane protein EcfT [Alphaproteobacteria bacterium]|nr:energy-coupling factor transporter transmembrane protein EcfT [Alphaproteobacteria bacterium]
MIFDSYRSGDSVLHRMAPGPKLLSLCVLGTLLFFFDEIWLAATAFAAVSMLYPLAGFGPAVILAQLRPVFWVFVLIVAAQLLFGDAAFGVVLALRLAALVLLAALVTLTTRSSEIVDALIRTLAFLRPLGVNPARVGLTISLALRFLPVLARITGEVREAQHARGHGGNPVATAIPTTVRTLKMAHEIAEAIEARGFDD